MTASSLNNGVKISRRTFVKGAALAGSGLILTIHLPGCGKQEQTALQASELNAFVRIGTDDSIRIVFPCSEMGQGSSSGLPMILAEEMEADWDRVEIVPSPVADAFRNPRNNAQRTGGSGSIRGWYAALRETGAAAREMLIAAAAQKFGVPKSECHAVRSRIIHEKSKQSLRFGQVADLAATLERPPSPALKSPRDFRLIGHPMPRKDIPAKVNGTAGYGIDVDLPNMLYAGIKGCPAFGGELISFDAKAAAGKDGVHAVLPIPGGIAVVADSYWQAQTALQAIDINWNRGPNAGQNSARISADLDAGTREAGQLVLEKGDVLQAINHAEKILEARYEVPFLAHACMEPVNCTADVRNNRCEIWAPTQNPQWSRDVVAKQLGLRPDNVLVNTTLLGGGFGRKGEIDFVLQAVALSRAVGRPVKLIWSREQDIQHDFYRPATAMRFRAGFDAEGQITALDMRIVAPSIISRFDQNIAKGAVDWDAIKNIGRQQPYAFPNIRVEHVRKDHGIPIGFWRSVGHSQNAFMRESFIDEMAHEADTDPYTFRRNWLEPSSRDLAVLDLAADKAGWGKSLPAGHFQGIAMAESYGSWVVEIAEVSIEKGLPRVHKVTAAIDCGTAVNPDSVRAQVEGAIVYGLTAALKGEITLREGCVEQSNFHDYRMLRISEMPEVAVHISGSDAAPGGVGEPGTPPIAPAVSNAIFAATGTRIRNLPILKHDRFRA
ncbi:MAG: molybdopterin cofactor-binding domain-containing protein [Gammaproteobacteria bacterium]